jgi:hypothetical protein
MDRQDYETPKTINIYHYGDADKWNKHSVIEQELMPVVQLPCKETYMHVSFTDFPSGLYSFIGCSPWNLFTMMFLLSVLTAADVFLTSLVVTELISKPS